MVISKQLLKVLSQNVCKQALNLASFEEILMIVFDRQIRYKESSNGTCDNC
jgi:hypothetical protein